MSAIFYSTWLWHRGDLGWATATAWFENCPVEANINLSGFDVSNTQQFAPFQQRFAYAYIETPETPIIVVGGLAIPNANRLTDNTVWLTTDHLTFQLEASNVTASAVGVIYDRRPDAVSELNVQRTLDFAVHDEDGSVVGTHREVQLYGGKELDDDAVQERVLLQARSRSDQSLLVTAIELDELPIGVEFRIDPSNGRAMPLEYD